MVKLVASHRGAWIEIFDFKSFVVLTLMSRPTGARGLKLLKDMLPHQFIICRVPQGRVD